MRYLIYALILAAAPSFAADDPGGWSKALWGMTDDELIQAFPSGQVVRFSHVDSVNKARVGIESFEVAGSHFKVYLCPGPDDRLAKVIFDPLTDADKSASTFQSLGDLLVEKYGRPWKSDEKTDTTELRWTFKTTLIHLSRTVIGLPSVGVPMKPFLNLIYTRTSPDANPL